MSDARFDHDLQHVLREIAGGEAPMSLRYRLADLVDQVPPGRRLQFTPTLRLSMAVVAAVAVVALAILFLPGEPVGPSPSASPATPSASSSATESEAATPTPAATPAPTPAPSVVRVASWTAVRWSSMPWSPEERGWTMVSDVVAWDGGYVGIGAAQDESERWGVAIYRSEGTSWSVDDFQPFTSDDWSNGGRLVVLGDELLAASYQDGQLDGPVSLRASTDGSRWETIDGASWQASFGSARLLGMAAGPAGVVAIGAAKDGSAVIVHSLDGRAWQRISSPAVASAVVRDVTTFGTTFVIVGRTGEADVTVDGVVQPGAGSPAAWVSSDGQAWTAADVEGSPVVGGELRDVAAAAEGLFARGFHDDQAPAAGTWESLTGTHGWASTDGRTWRLVGEMGADLPGGGLLAGDGVHMVLIGEDPVEAAIAGDNEWVPSATWASTDGMGWRLLASSGADAPGYLHCPPETAGCGGSPRALWVAGDRLVVTMGSLVPMHSLRLGEVTGP